MYLFVSLFNLLLNPSAVKLNELSTAAFPDLSHDWSVTGVQELSESQKAVHMKFEV